MRVNPGLTGSTQRSGQTLFTTRRTRMSDVSWQPRVDSHVLPEPPSAVGLRRRVPGPRSDSPPPTLSTQCWNQICLGKGRPKGREPNNPPGPTSPPWRRTRWLVPWPHVTPGRSDPSSNLLLSVGHDAVYCFCNSRSVSLTNPLPWLDKPRLLRDRSTSRYDTHLPFSRGLKGIPNRWHALISDASNVLVISTEMAAKPDDAALMFFFR